MSVVYLAVYVLIVVLVISAISGILMFFVDMVRFGTPHKRFETVSSIEKYNERLSEIENEIKDTAADQQAEVTEPIEIDL